MKNQHRQVVAAIALGVVAGICYPTTSSKPSSVSMFPVSKAQIAYPAIVTRVIDGDTFVATASTRFFAIDLSSVITCRLADVNAPEIHGETKSAGEAASKFAKDHLLGHEVTVHAEHTDNFGRWIAHVTVDGKDFNQTLVSQGFAVPYMVGK